MTEAMDEAAHHSTNSVGFVVFVIVAVLAISWIAFFRLRNRK
jgi:hypothetical protein